MDGRDVGLRVSVAALPYRGVRLRQGRVLAVLAMLGSQVVPSGRRGSATLRVAPGSSGRSLACAGPLADSASRGRRTHGCLRRGAQETGWAGNVPLRVPLGRATSTSSPGAHGEDPFGPGADHDDRCVGYDGERRGSVRPRLRQRGADDDVAPHREPSPRSDGGPPTASSDPPSREIRI